VIAEATAREIGLNLEEALQLVLLYVAYEPTKHERAALRWFGRYLEEGKDVSLLADHCESFSRAWKTSNDCPGSERFRVIGSVGSRRAWSIWKR
jgi:hypothetical protein